MNKYRIFRNENVERYAYFDIYAENEKEAIEIAHERDIALEDWEIHSTGYSGCEVESCEPVSNPLTVLTEYNIDYFVSVGKNPAWFEFNLRSINGVWDNEPFRLFKIFVNIDPLLMEMLRDTDCHDCIKAFNQTQAIDILRVQLEEKFDKYVKKDDQGWYYY